MLPAVYDGLRAYVAERLSRVDGRALDATEVVHEVYLRLAAQVRATYVDEAHFFAVAAGSVRRVLVDHARRAAASKRGGDRHQTSLDSRVLGRGCRPIDVLSLDEALEALAADDARAAKLVDLRFFGGLTFVEAATELGISTATAERDWRYARAFLYDRLGLG